MAAKNSRPGRPVPTLRAPVHSPVVKSSVNSYARPAPRWAPGAPIHAVWPSKSMEEPNWTPPAVSKGWRIEASCHAPPAWTYAYTAPVPWKKPGAPISASPSAAWIADPKPDCSWSAGAWTWPRACQLSETASYSKEYTAPRPSPAAGAETSALVPLSATLLPKRASASSPSGTSLECWIQESPWRRNAYAAPRPPSWAIVPTRTQSPSIASPLPRLSAGLRSSVSSRPDSVHAPPSSR